METVVSIPRQILVQAILILLNAFFASAEIAVISLNHNKLKKQAEEGDKKSSILLKMVENPSNFLSTIQIGITLAGFLGSALAADTLAEELTKVFISWGATIPYNTLNTISVFIITIIISFFTLIFGELVPKRIAQQKAEGVARFCCSVLNVLSKIMRPVIWLLSFCTNTVLRLFRFKANAEEEPATEEDIRLMVDSVVKRDVVGQIVEITLLGFRGGNGACHFSDIVNPFFAVFRKTPGRRVWPRISTGRPNDNKLFAFVIYHFNDGKIFRLNQFTLVQQIFLVCIDFLRRHSLQWKGRSSILFFNADHNIAAAPVVDIIGKRTYRFE